MKYFFLLLTLCLLSCQDEPLPGVDQDTILGNWLVVRETDKSANMTKEDEGGIVTTWSGVTYISAIKIKEGGSVKINKFDNSYTTTDTEGTWKMSATENRITFDIQSFTKDFSIRREGEFLVLESPTHIIWHKTMP